MPQSQGERVLRKWQHLRAILEKQCAIDLQGDSLTISNLIAVSCYNAIASVDRLPEESIVKIHNSVEFLHERLAQGHSIYGVTTGFGGSANTNTTETNTLQVSLLQMQLSAVLPVDELEPSAVFPWQNNWSSSDDIRKLAMPEAWVRGAMLVRANSLLRGHSAVRLGVIKALLKLLEHDLIPLVPLRGSISASGDLCPLSYVAAVLEGNPDVKVWSGPRAARQLLSADQAIHQVGISAISFGPKEILGMVNGTAFSVAVATLAHHQAETLVVMAQIVTAMSVEALLGTVESFDSFIGAVRPHPGQIEVARNIRVFLKGSRLARSGDEEESYDGQLRQDRYALRTSAQWMGPFLEDMKLARRQLEIEMNSTTDNPLIDAARKQVHHGGNFQATAVTSSTEKTRTTLEKIGRMIFAQSTELLDVRLNHHLPPNLAADEPSLSYTLKGVDINMASYMSELGFLANPVGNHVQSAEMGNQAINSLALISARYTHMAVDVLSLMLSAHLYSVCQALDLRAMNSGFMTQLEPEIHELTSRVFGILLPEAQLSDLHQSIWATMVHTLSSTTSIDSADRFTCVAQSAQHLIVNAMKKARPKPQIIEYISSGLSEVSPGISSVHLGSSHSSSQPDFVDDLEGIKENLNIMDPLSIVTCWTDKAASISKDLFISNRERYLAAPDATDYLGSASKRMYRFVRDILNVPMNKGLVDHPTFPSDSNPQAKKNTGTQISIIYKALRDEKLVVPIMECLTDAIKPGKIDGVAAAKL